MSNFRSIDPCPLLAPVPAVMVSCRGTAEDAQPNIITIAWAGTVNSHPPMVSISVRPERYSYAMIKESGEFVVNLVGREQLKAVDFCGVKSGRSTDKWQAMGLTPEPARGLDYAPAIAECPAYLACKVKQAIPLGSHEMFIGEVVAIGVQEHLFDPNGGMHLDKAGLVCYNHGVYQLAGIPRGFFGFSLANEKVFKRRMEAIIGPKK